jgi:hypothetical protein
MRFKKRSQLPGAGRTRGWHHHGSHTSTSPGTILLVKMAYHTKQIHLECSNIPAYLQNLVRNETVKVLF